MRVRSTDLDSDPPPNRSRVGLTRGDQRRTIALVDHSPAATIALECGAALAALEVEVSIGHASPKAAATWVGVGHALREDSPRPAKGFREPVEWIGWATRLAALGALAGWIAWRIVAHRRCRAAVVVSATAAAAEQIAQIATEPRDDPDARLDLLFAVTRIVRTVPARVARPRLDLAARRRVLIETAPFAVRGSAIHFSRASRILPNSSSRSQLNGLLFPRVFELEVGYGSIPMSEPLRQSESIKACLVEHVGHAGGVER